MRRNLTPDEKQALSTAGRIMASQRKTFGGGRPRLDVPRCECGKMTLKRAQARGKSAEHLKGCSFAR